jgi:hypothetical protein
MTFPKSHANSGYDVGVGYLGETRIGEAYERSTAESDFGLPENYDDPTEYRPKSPACNRQVGIDHSSY